MAEIVIKLVNGELAGKTMQSITKEVNAAALALKKAEVGTQAWVDANKKLAQTKQLQADLKKQIEGTTQASDMLKKAWNSLPGAQYFNQVGQSFGMMKQGVGGLVTQFGVLKTAIAATGLGALLLIVTSLVTWFKNVNTGADLMEDALAAVRATVDVLIDRMGKFINGLIRFAKGDFKAGIDEMAASFNGMGDEILRDVNAAQQLAAAMRDLEDAEIDYKIRAAETENQIKALMLQARNRTLSEKERIALLDQALALEKDLNNELMKNSEEGLRIANEQAASRLNISRSATESEIAFGKRILEEFKKDGQVQADDLRDKVVDMLVTLEDAEGKSIALQEKIQNQRDALSEKQEEEARKQNEDELTATANIEDLKLAAMEEGLQKQLAQIELDTQRKIEALVGSEEQIQEQTLLLQEQNRIEQQEAKDQWEKEQQEKDYQKRLEDQELALAIEQNALSERLLAGQITEQTFAEESAQNAMLFQERKLQLIKEAHGAESAEYQRAYGEFLMLQKSQADMAVAIKKQEMADQLAAMQGSLGVFGDFFSAVAGMQQQGTAQWKSFATTAAILSTIQGAINAYTSTAAIPVVGSVLAPIAAGLALAAGYANVRKIQNTKVQPPTKAERGYVLRGPSHANGGIPIEAEGDEIILTKGVYRNPRLRAMASDINAAAGGVRFAAGGPVSPFVDRSPMTSTRSSSNAGGDSVVSFERLENYLMKNFEAVNSRIDRIQVINDVTKTQEGINVVNQIKADADV